MFNPAYQKFICYSATIACNTVYNNNTALLYYVIL